METKQLSRYGSILVQNLALSCLVVFLAGCSALPKQVQQSLALVTPSEIDFREIEYYALRSKAAYGSAEEIRSGFPDTTRVATVEQVDVQYFLETDPKNKTQTIAIRGTANKKNIWQDANVLLVEDDHLGVRLHRGFRDDTLKVYQDLKVHLKKDYQIRVTGHSLGGAIALILTNYLYRDGYDMQRLVTFGQPKVTDDKSDHHYRQTNPDYRRITRVAYYKDPIALVPPTGVAVRYGHVGAELILRDGPDYVFLDAHDADRLSVGNFWRHFGRVQVKEHFMTVYLQNIQDKIKNGSRQVPYEAP